MALKVGGSCHRGRLVKRDKLVHFADYHGRQ
jgi:hypothetical protein